MVEVRIVGRHVHTPPPVEEARGMLLSVLDEPELSAAAQAVDAVVWDYLREAVRCGDTRGGSWPSVQLAVDRGAPAGVLVRSLWQAHMRLMDGLVAPPAAGATDAARRALTSFTFHCCEDVARAYGSQENSAPDGQERRLLVDRILYGDSDIDVDEAERVLGVCCSHNHWAMVLSSTRGSGPGIEDMVRFARVVARSVGCAQPLLVLDNRACEVWMWIQWPQRPPRPEVIASARARLRVTDGLQICSGPVLPHLTGFRRSMLLAQATRKTLGATTATGWHHHTDTSPVSLLIDDREEADWFVEDTLGELGQDDPRTAILRETLRLYLAHGRSRQQVAAAMFINRNTVAYRVQKAEELLGRPIDQDPFELRLALEILRADSDRSSPSARATPAEAELGA